MERRRRLLGVGLVDANTQGGKFQGREGAFHGDDLEIGEFQGREFDRQEFKLQGGEGQGEGGEVHRTRVANLALWLAVHEPGQDFLGVGADSPGPSVELLPPLC